MCQAPLIGKDCTTDHRALAEFCSRYKLGPSRKFRDSHPFSDGRGRSCFKSTQTVGDLSAADTEESKGAAAGVCSIRPTGARSLADLPFGRNLEHSYRCLGDKPPVCPRFNSNWMPR